VIVQPGKIITFYSYKGGTGRTMALANLAWILASAGRRVLAVDWDLEAPGLHRFFHPYLVDPELAGTTGVMDMIWEFGLATLDPSGDAAPGWHESYADATRYAVSLRHRFPDGGLLDLLPAGQQDAAYAEKVNGFNWGNFYRRMGGAGFIAALRRGMVDSYDYALIDSRTGVSDTAGICTVALPDVLVNCFTFSTQSITGAAAVAESVRGQRLDDPVRIWPVPMRVENGETAKLEFSRDLARNSLGQFLDGVDPAEYWGRVEVPYRTLYAYEEILATIGDRPRTAGTILAACEHLCEYVTDGEITELTPLSEDDRRRELRRFERAQPADGQEVRPTGIPATSGVGTPRVTQPEANAARIFVSYSAADDSRGEIRAFLTDLERSLVQVSGHSTAGMIFFAGSAEHSAGTAWNETLVRELERCDVFLPLLSPSFFRSAWASREWGYFESRLLRGQPDDRQPARLIVPVSWRPVESGAIPAIVAGHQVIPARGNLRRLRLSDPPAYDEALETLAAALSPVLVQPRARPEPGPEPPGNLSAAPDVFGLTDSAPEAPAASEPAEE